MEVFKNKIFINTLFFGAIVIASILLLLALFENNNKIYIPLFGKMDDTIRINVQIKEENLENFEFYSGENQLRPQYLIEGNSYVFYEEDEPTNLLYFWAKDNKTLNSIDNIIISIGRNFYYYTNDDIKNFKHTKNGDYLLPNIKYSNSSKYINDKGKIHRFATYFLSIFYNTKYYILPLSLFLFAVLIYLLNKEKFNFNFNFFKNNAIWFILAIALIIRLSDNNMAFWGDELYTASVASGINRPWIAVFQDPGNPPFFFILAKIWMIIFGTCEWVCRLLPTFFSVGAVYLIYLFIKRNTGNINFALLAGFLLAINVFSMHYALDFRAYSLMGFLCVLSGYYLFEIINYRKTKDFIIYAVVAAIMANTHYFLIFTLIINFVLAFFMIDKKSKIKFLSANLFAVLLFLPHFLYIGLNKGLLDNSFNQFPNYELTTLLFTMATYLKNRAITTIVFVCATLMSFKKVREKLFNGDDKFYRIYAYIAFSSIMVVMLSYLFSNLVRPIVRAYYYMGVLPFLSALVAGAIVAPFRNKILKFLVSFYLLTGAIFCISGKGLFVNRLDNIVIRAEEAIKYQYFDSEKYRKKGKVIGLAVIDYPYEYIDFYKNYVNKNNTAIIGYRFGITSKETFLEKFESSGADVIYMMLHYAMAKGFTHEFSAKYNTSLVITDENVVLAKLIKK